MVRAHIIFKVRTLQSLGGYKFLANRLAAFDLGLLGILGRWTQICCPAQGYVVGPVSVRCVCVCVCFACVCVGGGSFVSSWRCVFASCSGISGVGVRLQSIEHVQV